MTNAHNERAFISTKIALLTVSDSRTLETDSSGQLLQERLQEDGHELFERALVVDNIYGIRAQASQWIAHPQCSVIITTGGTGVTGRDGTPEALEPLFDKMLPGFGELFRYLSLSDIGTSSLQSRATAGVANGTFIFALPGSTGACRLGWEQILSSQLDYRTQPCNFVDLMPRLTER